MYGGSGIREWGFELHHLLKGITSLKRLTFWFEGQREDAHSWARLLFLKFHDTLARLEHVSCVDVGPGVSTSFDLSSGCFPILRSEDNRTRGHRAANDVRELMPIPVLCCDNEEGLCDAHSHWNLHLDRAEMEY